jgi:hypothetical protein
MNDTTPRTVRIVAGGSGAVGRESAEWIATVGKAVVVAYAGNPDDHPERMMTGHARAGDRSSESLATWSPRPLPPGRADDLLTPALGD